MNQAPKRRNNIQTELSAKELAELLVTVGSHRKGKNRPIQPIEVGKRIKFLLANGKSIEAIQQMLDLKDASMIQKFLKILDLPVEYHEMIVFGSSSKDTIGLSIANEILRINDNEMKKIILDKILAYTLKKEQVIEITQRYLKRIKENQTIKIEDIINDTLVKIKVISEKEVTIGPLTPEIISIIENRTDDFFISIGQKIQHLIMDFINKGQIDRFIIKKKFFYLISDSVFQKEMFNKFHNHDEEIIRYINSEIIKNIL